MQMQVGYWAERRPVKTHSSEKENRLKTLVMLSQKVEHIKVFNKINWIKKLTQNVFLLHKSMNKKYILSFHYALNNFFQKTINLFFHISLFKMHCVKKRSRKQDIP